MNTTDTQNAIVDLQIRVAHQEVTLQELNDVVCMQQREIERLRQQVRLLQEQARAQSGLGLASPQDEGPPPHY